MEAEIDVDEVVAHSEDTALRPESASAYVIVALVESPELTPYMLVMFQKCLVVSLVSSWMI